MVNFIKVKQDLDALCSDYIFDKSSSSHDFSIYFCGGHTYTFDGVPYILSSLPIEERCQVATSHRLFLPRLRIKLSDSFYSIHYFVADNHESVMNVTGVTPETFAPSLKDTLNQIIHSKHIEEAAVRL